MLGLTDVISCARTLVLLTVAAAALSRPPWSYYLPPAAAQIMARFVIALGYWMVKNKKALDHRRSHRLEWPRQHPENGPVLAWLVEWWDFQLSCPERCVYNTGGARPNLLLSSPYSPCRRACHMSSAAQRI